MTWIDVMKMWADSPLDPPQDVDEAIDQFKRRMRLWEITRIMEQYNEEGL